VCVIKKLSSTKIIEFFTTGLWHSTTRIYSCRINSEQFSTKVRKRVIIILVLNYYNGLVFLRLESSIAHRRELNNLIRHEATTVDEVKFKNAYIGVAVAESGQRHLTENKDPRLWVQSPAAHASSFLTPDCKKINSVRVIVICSHHRLLWQDSY